MKKIQGTKSDFAYFKEDGGRFVIGYGLTQLTDTLYEWFEITIYKRQQPIVTLADVKRAIIDGIDKRTTQRIVSGFVWDEKPVWLSMENQGNFAAAERRAATSGSNLPWHTKIGELADGTPVYHDFTTAEDLTAFWNACLDYIDLCLQDGRQEKDGINWVPYEALFPTQQEQPAIE